MPRIRIHHTKNHLLQYTGTLDMQKIWERTLRRAQLPIEYSQGFHPQPKIQLACPLPLGMTSQSEFVDFWLEKPIKLQELQAMIEKAKHEGVDILDIQVIEGNQPSLQSRLASVRYHVILPPESLAEKPGIDLQAAVSALLAKESIMLERRGKQYDLRPLIEDCSVSIDTESSQVSIDMTLASRPKATGRPEEVLKVIGFDPDSVKIEREEIIFEPLPVS